MENQEILKQTKKAIDDYEKFVPEKILQNANPEKYVKESYKAKEKLRRLFRRHKNWSEQLQAIAIENTIERKENDDRLAGDIERLFLLKPFACDLETITILADFFAGKELGDEEEAISILKVLAPDAYHKGRKKSRILHRLCTSLGIADDKSGSSYQKLYSKIADRMDEKKGMETIFLSIHPAHFLTMSNPKWDRRGETLVTCHSLNDPESRHNGGCTGLGLDETSFIVFTVKDPEDASALNNRKTVRGHFAYDIKSKVLLQGTIYGASCCNWWVEEHFLAFVKQVIDKTEKKRHDIWQTEKLSNYRKNNPTIIITHGDYCGYKDWEDNDHKCTISMRGDENQKRELFIGEKSLCLYCGTTLTGLETVHIACERCMEKEFSRCDHCQRPISKKSEAHIAKSTTGNTIKVCSSCFEKRYVVCEKCGDAHYEHTITTTEYGENLCFDCMDAGEYKPCALCHGYYRKEDYTPIARTDEVVCNDCSKNDRYYKTCDHCGQCFEVCREGMMEIKDASGIKRLCRECYYETT